MTETTIVGVTDAAVSRRALDWAVARARARHDRIRLFSVVGGAVGAVGERDIVAQVVDATATQLQEIAASLALEGLDVSAEVVHGDPVALLVGASKDAGLLVIGGEPRGRGHRGQHGTRIAAGAHSPVVVVPEAGSGARHGVVVGVDGSETSEAAIAFAADEAARLGEPLIVLSAWLPVAVPGDFGVYPEVYLTDLEGLTTATADRVISELAVSHPGLEVRRKVAEGDPGIVIGEAAENASLVVVGSHGRSGFARFLLGSVSEEVVARLAAPTAVVR